MNRCSSKIYSAIIMLFFLNSLIYFEFSSSTFNNSDSDQEIQTLIGLDELIDTTDPDEIITYTPIKKVDTPGSNHQIRGFFQHYETVDIDSDGIVWEYQPYEEMMYDGESCDYEIHRFESSLPLTMPPRVYQYYTMWENDIEIKSAFFTPVFEHGATLSGKIHLMTNVRNEWTYNLPQVRYQINIFVVDPASPDTPTDTGLYYYHTFYEGDTAWYGDPDPREFTLSSPINIPAGNRLKIRVQARLNRLNCEGHFRLYTNDNGLSTSSDTWDISDGIYSTSYTIFGLDKINAGLSLYMYEEKYPTISVSGFSNDTYYVTENKNVSIDVSDSVDSSYRWDGGAYVPFDDSTWTMSPAIYGWHTLDVKGIDEYGNTRTETYQIGYDSSSQNLVLVNPPSGSLISENTQIQLNDSGIDYALHEWDKNGTFLNTTALNYLLPVPNVAGYHNLTITTYDVFETVEFFYVFTVDNSPAVSTLVTTANNTAYPAGKVIDILITDETSIDVQYKWDSQDKFTWIPFTGDTYRTYLPGLDGEHFLYLYTNDSFGHYKEVTYRFITDNSQLGVELQNMNNNSYCFGGDEVVLTITGSNTTVYYNWNGGLETGVNITGSTLTLNGSDSLPNTIGVHFLTIRTFDIPQNEKIFTFYFTVDKEAPIIDPSIYDYNNMRYTTDEIFTFSLSDNNISSTELSVKYSLDGGTNISLSSPFELALSFFSEGTYTLTLYVTDIAQNLASASFSFTIDMTPPIIDVLSIEGLQTKLGVNYAPANPNIIVSITDDDPSILSTYSWGASYNVSFLGSFILSYSSGTSVLYINATDSLNHKSVYVIQLTIDGAAPNVVITTPFNNSKINSFTSLRFTVSDILVGTIEHVEYGWDIFSPATASVSYDSSGIFELKLPAPYSDGSSILSINAVDLVGNSKTYIFTFTVDKTPPLPALYVYNEDTSTYEELFQNSESNPYLVRGNTSIWYDASKNDDFDSLLYSWNNEVSDYSLNLSLPYIFVLTDDGLANLTVTVEDDTIGSHPNSNKTIYFFYIDDIHIEAVYPSDILDGSLYNLEYSDVFQFMINISDFNTGLAIPNLYWNRTILQLSNTLNLLITNNTITSQIFQFIIYCTNISTTSLDFEFSAGDSAKHTVTINLSILKKEGSLSILADSELSVIYENDIVVNMSFRNDIGVLLNISDIYVNGTKLDDIDFQDLGNYIYQFTYSSLANTPGKGHYTLEILVESMYYFGQTNSPYLLEFDVLSIPIEIEIFVSGYNITYGNTVVISALLSRSLTGAPIINEELVFYIYIYNKKGGVFAFSDYNNVIPFNSDTNSTGFATITFLITSDMDHIAISVEYLGTGPIYGSGQLDFNDFINAIKPPGLSSTWLYIIIAGAVILAAIISYVVYKLTRSPPIDEVIIEVTESEIMEKLATINPGVILNIFDQRRGAIPLVSDHDLDTRYNNRFAIGMDNFLLKIADQAYSSLGFEEQHDRRRIGSIILPREGMVGFIHGIQLPNADARGGFENLALVVLVNEKDDNALLGNQVYLYDDVDTLTNMLKERRSIEEINEQLLVIRKKAVRIVLAALRLEKRTKRKEE